MGDFEKLLAYARGRNVLVKFVRTVGEFGIASYALQMNEIHLDLDLKRDDPETLYIMSHELGHELDFSRHGDDYYVAMTAAEGIFEDCVVAGVQTPDQIADVVEMGEKRAWDLGEQILEKVGIRLKKTDMKKWRREAMAMYREAFRGLRWNKLLTQ